MSTIGLLFLVGTCMLFPVSIGWIIVCITEHRKEKKYDEFYSIHGVRKHGEVVYYQEEIMRSQNGYVFNIIIKFYDENNKPHSATIHTNHRSARKYATVKEDVFLCLYDAIIANDSTRMPAARSLFNASHSAFFISIWQKSQEVFNVLSKPKMITFFIRSILG